MLVRGPFASLLSEMHVCIRPRCPLMIIQLQLGCNAGLHLQAYLHCGAAQEAAQTLLMLLHSKKMRIYTSESLICNFFTHLQ